MLERSSSRVVAIADARQRKYHETEEAKALIKWATYYSWGPLLTHTANERAGKLQRQILAAIGVRKGQPDFTLYLPRGRYPGLVFEFKASPPFDATITRDQRQRCELLGCVGYASGVVKGWDRARALIEAYLALEPGRGELRPDLFDWVPPLSTFSLNLT